MRFRAGAFVVLLTACARGEQPPSQTLVPTAAGQPGTSARAPTTSAKPVDSASSATRRPASQPAWANKPPYAAKSRVDLIIESGRIIDGSGGPVAVGAVVIDGDRIVHVGSVAATVEAAKRIDARGKVVTPGFIDAHSHASAGGANHIALTQGVTTVCIGQDGRSPGGSRIAKLAAKHRKPLMVNVAPFAGHGTLRYLAGIGLSKSPSSKGLKRLRRIAREEMAAGAFGISTGLEYTPGRLATAAELVAVAKPVAAAKGVVMSHLRSEDDDAIAAAVDELVTQGRRAGCRVHISHIKVVHAKGASRAEQLLARLANARKSGVAISADIYPYVASYTTIGIVFPAFAKPPNDYARVRRSQRRKLAAFLRAKVAKRGGPGATLFGTPPWRGKTLAQLAAQQRKPFEEVLIEMGPRAASAAYFVMDEALQSRLLRDPHVMVSSDGSINTNHPRARGSFAKIIRRYVTQTGLLPLREAVRKMTALPAHTIGLDQGARKRGQLRTGWAADVLVFDPAKVRDHATYTQPRKLSSGMDWVVVNGVITIARGKALRQRGGRLLLRSR